jgi:hypothetical protein
LRYACSHIRTLSMLIFQDLTSMRSTLFIPGLTIWTDFACVSPALIKYTFTFYYHWTHLYRIMDARTILYITILTPFQPNKSRSFLIMHWSSSSFLSSLTMERHHPQPWKLDKGIMSTSMTFQPKEELIGRSIDSSAPTILICYLCDRGIPCNHISLLITSPSFVNLETRFPLRGEGCNTQCYDFPNHLH